MKFTSMVCCAAVTISLLAVSANSVEAGDKDIKLADGQITMKAPGDWEKKQPRTRIVEYEFATKAADGDKLGGRITVMGAGGSIEANINRWIAQFSQTDGKATRDRTKIEKFKVAGQEVQLVDISGQFKDQRGPFAPATIRDDYRMLGAIIVTDGLGQYFVKLTGPKKTVAANEKAFKGVIDSLKVEKK